MSADDATVDEVAWIWWKQICSQFTSGLQFWNCGRRKLSRLRINLAMYIYIYFFFNVRVIHVWSLSDRLEILYKCISYGSEEFLGPEQIISILLIRESIPIFRYYSILIISLHGQNTFCWLNYYFQSIHIFQVLPSPGDMITWLFLWSVSSTLALLHYLRWGTYNFLPGT